MAGTLPPILEDLLRQAQSKGASDLHLMGSEPPVMRVDGVLIRIDTDPLIAADVAAIAEAVVGKDDLLRIGREVGEIRRPVSIPGEVSGIMCVARAQGEYTIAIRILCKTIPTVDQFHVPKGILKAIESPNGLVVIAGLMGSGKSTTAYALIEYLNTHSRSHICTVEDPMFYQLTPKKALVQQRGVGDDVPDAISGIHAAIEQDGDVLFLNEVKSPEVLQACISVAETGHLVIFVMHAAQPEEAIRRMIEVFHEDVRDTYRRALSRVLRGVSTQLLLPSNAKGRVPVYGVLVPDNEMRAAIAEGRDLLARRGPMPEDCCTMAEDIERARCEGAISSETADDALARIHA